MSTKPKAYLTLRQPLTLSPLFDLHYRPMKMLLINIPNQRTTDFINKSSSCPGYHIHLCVKPICYSLYLPNKTIYSGGKDVNLAMILDLNNSKQHATEENLGRFSIKSSMTLYPLLHLHALLKVIFMFPSMFLLNSMHFKKSELQNWQRIFVFTLIL